MTFHSFLELGLDPQILTAIQQKNYQTATPIQAQAIPFVLKGRDLLAKAPTGSGKTAAFVLPILQKIIQNKNQTNLAASAEAGNRVVKALILAPTRDLCAQIGESIQVLCKNMQTSIKLATVYGGVSINPQMMHLRGGADIVVATPGRLLDLIDHNALKIDQVNTLVLDEADRLLDLGFTQELNEIFYLLPKKRQNLLFSATFPDDVNELAEFLLKDPALVEVAPVPASQAAISQKAFTVDVKHRTQLLRHLIEMNHWQGVLVFVASKHGAEIVAEKLRRARIYAEPFHGELSQGKRSQVLADFKAKRLKVVVATDVAARGLDIAELPVVINYDLPRSATDYVHRIGRTGRAGLTGLAVSFVVPSDLAHWKLIQKRNQVQIELEIEAGFEPQEELNDTTEDDATKAPAFSEEKFAFTPRVAPAAPVVLDPNGGVKGKRPSKKDKLRAQAALGQTQPTAKFGKKS